MTGIESITDQLITLEDGKTIDRIKFETWIDEKGKREWEHNWSNHEGEHQQASGIMTWGVYYQSDYLEKDIAEFLSARDKMNGKLKNMYDMGAGLKKLTKEIL